MIKFFRQIRYDLMKQNKTSKYFKYAIGEILLVVIGILIALQINNWNENRKMQKNEITLLNKLREENNLNIRELKDDSIYRQNLPRYLSNFMLFLKREHIETQKDSLQKYLANVLSAGAYSFRQNNLTNYLNLHQNSSSGLNTALGKLQGFQDDLQTVTEKSVDIKLNSFFDSIKEDIDFNTLEIYNFKKFKTIAFRNDVSLISNIEEEITRQFNDCLSQMHEVDSLINDGLKNE
ncbi:DUF6090 family protein [Winogradskyella flava]|uniref:Uncharacterized protein n=1 Tax=Winogradskyella flava TaxID=1884876 RepID=A0A842IQP6_9FLAO|nr:DUF6090 family protein [Winogradskyella flava]MBC2844054.1 hypothetical protein [Winogradskyella flava]